MKEEKKIDQDSQEIKRTFKGEVVSDKMEKTIVVRVDQLKLHPLYKKKYKSSKNYKVHDTKGEYKIGDVVEFTPCRPLSRDKRWRVIYKK